MRYAGFWPRLAALLIDTLVCAPLVVILAGHVFGSWVFAVVAFATYAVLENFYFIYLHGRWGQAIGKMCMRIRVVQLDGSKLSWTHAFLRWSVFLVLGTADSISEMTALLSVPKGSFESLSWTNRMELVDGAMPLWEPLVAGLMLLWLLCDLAVLIFSDKNRAIHDFIAGTIVVTLPSRRSGV
ncbi:MAG: RDD family protein [Planctomycetota bacterium]|jgi:uncharacterized RDD family membrane protein YckC